MAESENGSPVSNLKVEVRAGRIKETSPRYRKESHVRGGEDTIEVSTPISEFKGQSIFDRAKEGFEALVETIHPKKEYDYFVSPPKKEDGFRATIGRKLEKITSARSHNHQD
ncbi:unnamed protein product [Lactuca virosa]|uniref:Uncharacterized protein n=1 Tax=Lactuca virosa TaxID=75947 RepID=A0AAU9MEZ3_9ASTR|nr:unnamed protein product [Lactuca virosa]